MPSFIKIISVFTISWLHLPINSLSDSVAQKITTLKLVYIDLHIREIYTIKLDIHLNVKSNISNFKLNIDVQ